jgi:DNA-binding PadR family transcriptional regulator
VPGWSIWLDLRPGRERTIYRPSAKGRSRLEEALGTDNWATQLQAPPFVSWLGLSIHAAGKDAVRIVELRAAFLEQKIADERSTLREINEGSGCPDRIAEIMVALAIEQYQSELKAMDQVLNLHREWRS